MQAALTTKCSKTLRYLTNEYAHTLSNSLETIVVSNSTSNGYYYTFTHQHNRAENLISESS